MKDKFFLKIFKLTSFFFFFKLQCFTYKNLVTKIPLYITVVLH